MGPFGTSCEPTIGDIVPTTNAVVQHPAGGIGMKLVVLETRRVFTIPLHTNAIRSNSVVQY